MSSNRLRYDACAYATDIKESTSPLDYNLFQGKYINSKNCAVSDYTNTLEFTDRATVESELQGITRTNTQCPSLKYDPKKYYRGVDFSPPIMCDNIYYITPNNLEKPKTNMLRDLQNNVKLVNN
jgi:hypothetical protein